VACCLQGTHHATPETKINHVETPVVLSSKAIQSNLISVNEKIMTNIFLDHKGVLRVEFHDRDDTATAGLCATLERLRQAIRCLRLGLLLKDILHDKDRPHTNNGTPERLRRYGWEVTDNRPYSPPLAPSDPLSI
jgi:hypothetical protein